MGAPSAGGPIGGGGGGSSGAKTGIQPTPAVAAGAPPADERAGGQATAADGGGTGGGSGGGGDGRGSASSDARASRSETPAPQARPKSLFSDVPPIEKDASSGVDAPEAAPVEIDAVNEGADGKKRDEASGTLGTESRTDAAQPAVPTAGGVGDRGVGAAGADGETPGRSSPAGAVSGKDEAVTPAEDAAPRSGDAPDGGDGGIAATEGATVELPALDVERLDADGTILDRSTEVARRSAHPVTGIWEQIGGPNDADFGPGGYRRSVLMLNPALKTVAVYRVYRGDIALVVGGELALDAEPVRARVVEGALAIREDAASTSRFRRTPLALGGSPAVTIAPPAGDGPWDLGWRREGMELVLGEKRYAAISREAFEEVRRGGGDIASESDLADTVETRPADATTQRVNETSFFGLRGGGKRICFIIDISGSMMVDAKLDRVKQELSATIQALKPDTRFSVVFFDDQAHMITQAWMQTDAERTHALGVIAGQNTGGGTNPQGAFEFAFKTLDPLPDCIYYMTDGITQVDVAAQLRSLNGGPNKTTVHAIAFGNGSLEVVMRQIAAENGGTYLFVP
jgi:hypothetical protein